MMCRLLRGCTLRLGEVGSAPPPHSRFPRPGGGGAPHALVKPRRCERLRRVGSARDAQRRHRWVQTARHGWSGGPSPRANIAKGNLLHVVVIARRHRALRSSKPRTHKPAPRPRASRREPRVPKSQRPGPCAKHAPRHHGSAECVRRPVARRSKVPLPRLSDEPQRLEPPGAVSSTEEEPAWAPPPPLREAPRCS